MIDDKIKLLELWDKAGGDIYVYADLVAEWEREKNKEQWGDSQLTIALNAGDKSD